MHLGRYGELRHPVRPGDLCGIGIATIQAVMRQKLTREQGEPKKEWELK